METNNLRVLECSGTPYEIGRQYGENRATSIRKASELFFGALLNSPFEASKDEVKAKARETYLNSTRSFDPGSLDMVEGLAEGAGVDFDEAFALQCSIEVSLNYQHLMAMCDSLAHGAGRHANAVLVDLHLFGNADQHRRLLHPDVTKR